VGEGHGRGGLEESSPLVEATYEWPVAGTVTKASTADMTDAPQLFAQLQAQHPLALHAARVVMGDRGYDAPQFIRR
jgi:hypothetical protein